MSSNLDTKREVRIHAVNEARVRRFSIHFVVGCSLLMLPACAGAISYLYQAESEDEVVAPQPEYENTYADETPTIAAQQINDEGAAIAQLSASEAFAQMNFEEIEQTDPCVWAQREDQECSAIELPLSNNIIDDSPSAEVRLKMSGLTAPETLAFDADQTVDEIGRGRASSVAAQAVGDEFLLTPEQATDSTVPHPDTESPSDGSAAHSQNE